MADFARFTELFNHCKERKIMFKPRNNDDPTPAEPPLASAQRRTVLLTLMGAALAGCGA
ncbi:hypothetical protein LP420_03325 [Massilia sp. B-10]|nr:hypothetical protein LP420_03325 [Massilia sp. B-10]